MRPETRQVESGTVSYPNACREGTLGNDGRHVLKLKKIGHVRVNVLDTGHGKSNVQKKYFLLLFRRGDTNLWTASGRAGRTMSDSSS